jgi:hypothetical protein
MAPGVWNPASARAEFALEFQTADRSSPSI